MTYTIRAYSTSIDNTNSSIATYTFMTHINLLPPTNVHIITSTETSVTIGFTPQPDIEYTAIDKNTADGTWISTNKVAYPGSSVRFSNLPAGTSYRFDLKSNVGTNYSLSVSIMFAPRPLRFSKFNFTKGQQLTLTVQNGINYVTIMPNTEWNEFTTNINNVRAYKGLVSFPFTEIITATNFVDKIKFTYDIYNEAIDAMKELGLTTDADKVSKDSQITAECFTKLKDALNNV
jgi:hypothetical protein